MNDTAFPCDNIQTPNNIVISVLEHDIELTFSEAEDTDLFDRLRQTLFQTYIQTLVYPH